MSATDFSIDTRDIRFVLFEQLKIAETFATFPKYQSFDRDIYESMVEECAKICEDVIGPLNRTGDRLGAVLKDGHVVLPPGWKSRVK